MQSNVIVLAIGLSGSSVLTSLIHRAGYSLCGSTVAKPDYNTFENVELVRLNKRLLELAGCTDFGVVYRHDYVERVRRLYGQIEDGKIARSRSIATRGDPGSGKTRA